MSQVLAGAPTIRGLSGASASTITFSGVTATLKPLGGQFSESFNIEELNAGGDVVTAGADQPKQMFKLEMYVTGADVATARTLAKPTPLQVFTLANFPETWLNGSFNYVGNWNVALSKDVMKISCDVCQWGGAALTVL